VALSRYLPRAIAIAGLIATPAFAADQPLPPLLAPVQAVAPIPDVEYFTPRPTPAWQGELTARYWLGSAKTGKTLYDVPPDPSMVSRLTYSGMLVNAGELDGRIAFTNGWFFKGYFGFGAATHGSLQDEDFPPAISPYSSTTSSLDGNSLTYASADFGYDVFRGADFRIGAFAGYHYFYQVENGYGCTQNAGNPVVCQPAIPTPYEVITQNNTWQSVRLGLEGSVKLGSRFTLSAEGAWLPYIHLNGYDDHWLRIGTNPGDFTGGVPETGTGQGYQVEAVLSYQLTDYASVGIGGRYWHMYANGDTHFDGHIVGADASPQPVSWKTDIYGVFLQASLKLGPYPLGLGTP
jgi:hypothetical protein